MGLKNFSLGGLIYVYSLWCIIKKIKNFQHSCKLKILLKRADNCCTILQFCPVMCKSFVYDIIKLWHALHKCNNMVAVHQTLLQNTQLHCRNNLAVTYHMFAIVATFCIDEI